VASPPRRTGLRWLAARAVPPPLPALHLPACRLRLPQRPHCAPPRAAPSCCPTACGRGGATPTWAARTWWATCPPVWRPSTGWQGAAGAGGPSARRAAVRRAARSRRTSRGSRRTRTAFSRARRRPRCRRRRPTRAPAHPPPTRAAWTAFSCATTPPGCARAETFSSASRNKNLRKLSSKVSCPRDTSTWHYITHIQQCMSMAQPNQPMTA